MDGLLLMLPHTTSFVREGEMIIVTRMFIVVVAILTHTLISGCANNKSITLEVLSPSEGADLVTNIVEVVGTVSPANTSVTINGLPALEGAKKGSFWGFAELANGENFITLKAGHGKSEITRTVYVRFRPNLCIYYEWPYLEPGIDYTRVPVKITGIVNDPTATVTVNDIPAIVTATGTFSAEILLHEGRNEVQAVAIRNGQRDTWTVVVWVDENGTVEYTPGKSSPEQFFQAKVSYDAQIRINAGGKGLFDITLETGKESLAPDQFSFALTGASQLGPCGGEPVPSGFMVDIQPATFIAYPNTTYHTTMIIQTSKKLEAGVYYLCLERGFENSRSSGPLEIVVEQ